MNSKELCRIIKLAIPFKEVEKINQVGKGVYNKQQILEFLKEDIQVGEKTLEHLKTNVVEQNDYIEELITSVKNLIESEKNAIEEIQKLGNIQYQFSTEYMKEV